MSPFADLLMELIEATEHPCVQCGRPAVTECVCPQRCKEHRNLLCYVCNKPTDESEASPAPCGYIPHGGWPHKWARDGHRDTCDTCGDIEAEENAKRERIN